MPAASPRGRRRPDRGTAPGSTLSPDRHGSVISVAINGVPPVSPVTDPPLFFRGIGPLVNGATAEFDNVVANE